MAQVVIENLRKYYTDPDILIYTENEECLNFIKEFQTVLEKSGHRPKCSIAIEGFNNLEKLNSCFNVEKISNWHSYFGRNKGLCIKFNKKPDCSPTELVEKILEGSYEDYVELIIKK